MALDRNRPFATVQSDDGRCYVQDGAYFKADGSAWAADSDPGADDLYVEARDRRGRGPARQVRFAAADLSNTVTLTATDLAVLHNTSFELVPAPGAGKLLTNLSYAYIFQLRGGMSPQTDMSQPGNEITASYDGGDAHAKGGMLTPLWPAVFEDKFSYDTYGYSDISGASMCQLAAGVNKGVFAHATADLQVPGPIVTCAVGTPGSGYAVNDTFILLGELNDVELLGTVAAVDGGGGVTAFTLATDANLFKVGEGYGTTATSGAGDGGFTVNVTEVDVSVNPITLTIRTKYDLMDVPA